MVADAEFEVLFFVGGKPRFLGLVGDFKALGDDLLTDNDLDGQVEITSVVKFDPFFDDPRVHGVLPGFDLAAERDVEPHVHVLVRSKVDGHQVGVAAVGDGVVPGGVFWIVLSVLFDVSRVDDLPRRGARAGVARVGDSEVEEHRGGAGDRSDLPQRVVFTGAVAVGNDLDKDAEGSMDGESHVRSEFRVFFAGDRELEQTDVDAVSVSGRVNFHADGEDLRRPDVGCQRVNPFFDQFQPGVVVVESVLPVVGLFEDSDFERIRLEARVEHVEEKVAHFVGVDVVREGFIVGIGSRGIGDLFLMFVVFVDEETGRSKHVHFFEVQCDGANRNFFVLTLAVDGVDTRLDLEGVWSAVEVALGHLKLQLRNHGRTAAVERIRAAGCAPLRVGPGGRKVGLEVKHHVNAAGGGTRVLNEEFHLDHGTWSEQDRIGLIGG